MSADFYPLAPGDIRTWRETAGSNAGTSTHERVLVSTQLNGRTVVPVLDSTGVTTYYELSASAVQQVPEPGDDPLSVAIGPVTVLRLGQLAGQTDVTLDRTVNADIDGSGQLVPVDVRIESTFVGLESVDTGAGSFAGAAHVRTVLRVTVRPVGLPAVPITVTSDDWYARGVGPVKNISSTSSATGVTTSTDEVVAWGVGGRHSEAVAPSLVGASPVDGGSQSSQGPLTLSFSESIDPLSVDGSNGINLFDASGHAVTVTRVASGDGLQWTLTPVGALADGRYTWRVGAGVTDLAGNSTVASTGDFVVDTSGPQLAASLPVAASSDAALTGQIWLQFDEPVFAVPGSVARLSIFDPNTQTSQVLDATIQGDTLTATIPAPLLRNHDYMLTLWSQLADSRGNLVSTPISVSFRTDPGPLSRPQATDADAADVLLVKVADLDRDGRLDLVMIVQYPGSSDLHLAVRKALPGGGLAAAAEIMRFDNLAGWPYCRFAPPSMEVLDVDGDGRPDVLLPCASGSLVLKQAADGSFGAETVASVGTMGAFAVDPDGSGRGRFVTISFTGGVALANLLGRASDGSWTLSSSIDLGAQIPSWLRYADIDGDGRPDLVWLRANAAGTGVELASRLAAADGSLVPTQSAALDDQPLSGSVLADLDADGVPELVVSERYTDVDTGLTNARLRVWKRAPGGSYTVTQSPALLASASTVLVADLDGDGRADVMVAQDAARTVSVLLQGSDGLLQPERRFEADYGYRQSLAVMDVDGDGRRDLIVGTGVLLGRPYAGAWPTGTVGQANAMRSKSALRVPATVPASRGVRSATGLSKALRAAFGGR